MILLRSDPDNLPEMTPELGQEMGRRYTEWFNELVEEEGSGGAIQLAGDFVETAIGYMDSCQFEAGYPPGPIIGGVYFFEAENEDIIRDRVRTCPHLDYGGIMEIRKLME